jgi:hypothetical protein
MKIKNIIGYVFFLGCVWCSVNAVKPYWDKYWLSCEIERAAIYGTKNSIQDTKTFLAKQMVEDGRQFTEDDFYVEKNKWNDVTVSITYDDEIKVFGVRLKPLEFTVEKSSSEVRQFL